MTDETTETDGAGGKGQSATASATTLSDLLRGAWSSLRTIYYANSLSWRFLKSGALVFFGFFLWAGANIVYSYNPDLAFLRYPMAYGFILVVYGPVHHLVVLPLAFRWRRDSGAKQRLARHLPNAMLVLFLVGIVVLGTFPVGAMMVDFQGTLQSNSPDAVNPELACVKSPTDSGTELSCNLSESDGVGRVVVQSGNDELVVDEDPPYQFTIHEREINAVRGEKKFTVVIEAENGEMIRRYTRRVSMVEEE